MNAAARARSRPTLLLWITLLSILSLALIPAAFTYAYAGLPAHPLLLHIPVIFVPVAALAAIAIALRPEWIAKWGHAIAVIALVALVGTILTAATGGALEKALGYDGPPNAAHHTTDGLSGAAEQAQQHLVHDHQSAGESLRMFDVIATFALLLMLLSVAVRGGQETWSFADGFLRASWFLVLARTVTVLGMLACLWFVADAGHLGAKAAWYDRLHPNAPFTG